MSSFAASATGHLAPPSFSSLDLQHSRPPVSPAAVEPRAALHERETRVGCLTLALGAAAQVSRGDVVRIDHVPTTVEVAGGETSVGYERM